MWTFYDVVIQLDRITGGVPKHPELVRKWQEAVGGTAEHAERIVDDLGNQALDDTEVVQRLWTGFLSDNESGLYIEARQVKAMYKESANIVKKFFPNTKGKTPALKSQLAERVFVVPRKLYLGRTEPDGAHEKPIHVMTAQGPRSALKRVDYCEDVKLSWSLKVLDDKVITEKILRAILDHAAENGLGCDRSQGSGHFEVLSFRKVDTADNTKDEEL